MTNALLFNLLITNIGIIGVFALLYNNYDRLRDRLHFLKMEYKYLDSFESRTLYKHFVYFRKLSPVLKKTYENRVAHFIHSKEYVDVNGQEVSDKKKILIAAYAAQLTFGLENFQFSYFKKIEIYPTTFFSPISKEFRAWDIDPEGVILLSWKDFYLGLKNQENFGAVGLHLMANALKIEKRQRKLDKLEVRTSGQVANSGTGRTFQNGIFESADLMSHDNFFVACLIKFFESPLEFRNRYPGIFRDVDQMLHQGFEQKAS